MNSPLRPVGPDPIDAAITAARATHLAASAVLTNLDEDDLEHVCRANAAVDREAEAYATLCRVLPTSAEGLNALLAFHVEHIALMEPDALGILALEHVADAVAAILGVQPLA